MKEKKKEARSSKLFDSGPAVKKKHEKPAIACSCELFRVPLYASTVRET